MRMILALILLLSTTGCVNTSSIKLGEAMGTPSQWISACKNEQVEGLCEQAIFETHRDLLNRFKYTPDADYDSWNSHYNTWMQTSNMIYGDCDDYALTIARRLADFIPKEKITIFVVGMHSERPNHMVTGITYNGTTLVVDNNVQVPTTWEGTGYTYHFGMTLSEPGTWRMVK